MSGTRLAPTLVTLVALCSMSWAADRGQDVTPQSTMPSERSMDGSVSLVSATALTTPILQNAFEWEFIGTPTLYPPNDFVVVGDYAYCGTFYGLQVVDISDLENPTLVASLHVYLPAEGIAIQGSTAYLACGSLGLVTADISNPLAPVQLGSLSLPTTVKELIVNGNYVYTAGYGISFCVVDVSDPASPTEVGRYTSNPEITYVTDMELIGSNVFLTDHNGAFEVIDVSMPTSPRKISGYDTGHSMDFAVIGSTAYVASGTGLTVVDISNPRSLKMLTRFTGYYEAVAHNDGYLYAKKKSDGALYVFDVSVPGSPVELSGIPGMDWVARALALKDTLGFCLSSELRVVSVAEPSQPELLRIVPSYPREGGEVIVDGRYAFTMSWYNDSLMAFDLQNPTRPTCAGVYVGDMEAMIKGGDYIYLLNNTALTIIDVSDPTAMHAVGSRSDDYYSTGTVGIEGTRLYVSASTRVQVLDINDPTQPVLLGQYNAPPLSERAWGMAIRNDTAFLACGFDGVSVLSFSDPANPVLVGNYPSNGWFNPRNIAVSGNYVYAACGNYGLKIIDISTPASPTLVSELELINPSGVQVKGNLVFMDGSGAMNTVDVSRPESPQLVGSLQLRNNTRGFDIAGDMAVIVSGDGMLIARYSSCCEGITGNVDGFGATDLSDLTYLVSYLTGGGMTLTCATEANIDGRGIVDLGDLSAMVSYLTAGGFVLPNCP